MIEHLGAAHVVDATRAAIGEGPVWDERMGRLLWVDIPDGVIHSLDPGSGRSTRIAALDRSVGTVVPTDDGRLLAAAGTELLLIDGSSVEVVGSIDVDPDKVRFNDGKVGPDGRLWIGTQSTDGYPSPHPSLYVVGADLTPKRFLSGVTISNGIDWSSDGTLMYYIDTPTLGIDVFDVGADGEPSGRRRLITIPAGEGRPDGMTVDAEGFIWVALFYSGTVRRYSPSGEHVGTVHVSAPQVTSCAFGGADLRSLFITTASFRMPDERVVASGMPVELAAAGPHAPGAGSLFEIRLDVAGRPGTPFALRESKNA